MPEAMVQPVTAAEPAAGPYSDMAVYLAMLAHASLGVFFTVGWLWHGWIGLLVGAAIGFTLSAAALMYLAEHLMDVADDAPSDEQ